MDTLTYNCLYCHEEYIPKRRHSQKYCSNSCRSKAYHIRNRSNKQQQSPLPQQEKKETIKQESEKISIVGVGNAAIGSFLADAIKALLKTPDNTLATKGDIKIILDCIGQLHKIEDMPPRNDGAIAYFDVFSKRIVYKNPTGNILPDNPFRLV